jgi:ABC-type glycerol-3-phosphate transport system substrate-binding protein
LGGSNLAVSAMSENKELAWKWIRFLSEPERQLGHAQKVGALTARLASMERQFDDHPAVKKIFWDSIGHARRLPRLIPLGSVEQIVSQMCGRVLASIGSRHYNHTSLLEEINRTSRDIDTVLSVHKYGAPTVEAA